VRSKHNRGKRQSATQGQHTRKGFMGKVISRVIGPGIKTGTVSQLWWDQRRTQGTQGEAQLVVSPLHPSRKTRDGKKQPT